jgi:Uma2 family endonuclease
MITPPAEAGLRWTIHDLDGYDLQEGNRYEIIEGELFGSTQPHVHHQRICGRLIVELTNWADQGGGGTAILAPGVIFDVENAVAPDLAVEVLSPDSANTRRDREVKLRLYSVHGVREYWIVDWPAKSVQIYRHTTGALKLAATLLIDDELTSPLLPGFSLPVARLF